jgi:hypothetical protein
MIGLGDVDEAIVIVSYQIPTILGDTRALEIKLIVN